MRTGVPCKENRLFPVRIDYTGKTLFWPCTGPVGDCSVNKSKKLHNPPDNNVNGLFNRQLLHCASN